MRILVLHSHYLSGSASGENRVVEDESRLLSERGHHVDTWTPRYEGQGAIRTGIGAVWSRRARTETERRVSEQQIDVIHTHNLFPMLSPAVLRTDLPTVMTLHNFRLACLPATLLRAGRICEDCLGNVPWRGVLHGCYRDSRPASSVLATSLALHRAIRTFDRVDRFIVLSEFQRRKLVAAGLDAKRIVVRPNFAWPSKRRQVPGDYMLFVGRVSAEKGLVPLLSFWPQDMPLVVAGDGPELEHARAIAPDGVRFLGAIEATQVLNLLQRARALVVPSLCYEPFGRVIIEAFAAGVPVIANSIGGIPEVVGENRSGLLVPPGNEAAWVDALTRLADDRESTRLGNGAYESWRENFSPELALRSLEQIYRETIEHARTRGR